MGDRSAIIVGAGIGGLATAVGLVNAGWRVQILERHDRLRTEAAGLLLWPNGVRALRALGMGAALDAIATREGMTSGGLRQPDGRWLVQMGPGTFREASGEPTALVHRQDLHEALVAALGENAAVRTNATVTGLRLDGGPAVRLGGEELSADLVVAADGVHSKLRTAIDPRTRLVGAGQAVWQAVIPAHRAPDISDGGETQGAGRRFMYGSLGRRGLFWSATVRGSVRPESVPAQLQLLRRWFTEWHEPIQRILAATQAQELFQHAAEYLDPLPRRFVHIGATRGAALVGDAAHAMTPDLAQGAALALEDAVTLSACMSARTVPDGLRRYEETRRLRVAKVARTSQRVGKVFAAQGKIAVPLRDAMMRAMPDSRIVKSAAALADWTPPSA